MELTVEQFEVFDQRLQTLEQGQQTLEQRLQVLEQGQQALEQGQQALEQGQQALEQRLEAKISGMRKDLERVIVDSQTRVIQWVIGLFIGSMVLLATLGGVYISVLLAR